MATFVDLMRVAASPVARLLLAHEAIEVLAAEPAEAALPAWVVAEELAELAELAQLRLEAIAELLAPRTASGAASIEVLADLLRVTGEEMTALVDAAESAGLFAGLAVVPGSTGMAAA